MSIAAAQASKFYDQVVRDGKVFTFLEDGEFLVFCIGNVEVIPFWSSRSRMIRIQETQPKYSRFAIDEIPFAEFHAKTLKQLEDEGISVGLNWSGPNLTEYDNAVKDLRKCLVYQLEKQVIVPQSEEPLTLALSPQSRGEGTRH